MATVRTSWLLPPCSDDDSERSVRVLEAGSDASSVRGLMLASLPLVLHHPPPPQQPANDLAVQQVPCELALEWDAQQPLRCQQLQLEIISSARHVELFIEGVRRSLLGEDEQGEVYLGTFRGTKQSDASGVGGVTPQRFAVSQEFLQRDATTNVLKETQKLRVKFVSLTGDKSALHLQVFKCALVPLQQHPSPPQSMAPPAFAMPAAGPALAAQSNSSMAAQLAGLALHSAGGSLDGADTAAPAALRGINTQMLMTGFQQLLARDMESKILRAVDEKLATLSLRLAATEQRLAQLHQQVDANGSHVHASLAQIKEQLAQLSSHAQQQLAESLSTSEPQNVGDDGESITNAGAGLPLVLSEKRDRCEE